MNFLIVSLLILVSLVAADEYTAQEVCSSTCDRMKLDVLTLAMCRDAKKTLPKPKVGDFCTVAMEQGYSDACFALCMFQTPQNRVAQACRAASMEMPRPTVRKWCEHGYNVAYAKTVKDLKDYFGTQEPIDVEQEGVHPHHHFEAAKQAPAVVKTIPISLDDKLFDLNIHENENAEDALALFCNTNAADDTSGCIRHLLPIVLEQLEENV
eukprot:TRINITY_DN114281_c0_g1_i1.p1 TRINITY_DN114281_c0_g1~~TRINITY_DN114281_c0_g1_i1.p1  ORF type:complete len:210 (+),score=3.70 TRINITY_DN114281_c0_g1_i1:133-762(+)